MIRMDNNAVIHRIADAYTAEMKTTQHRNNHKQPYHLNEQELRGVIRNVIKETLQIREAMSSSFSWDTFNSILDNHGIVAAKSYCIQELGQPIGSGTSRDVFEIDDKTVLKLSNNSNDIMQNLHEYNIFQELKGNPLLPRIYAKSDDYIWLWCERVLPCSHADFEKVLGIPYCINYNYPNAEERNRHSSKNYRQYQTPKEVQTRYKDSYGDNVKLDFQSFLTWYEECIIYDNAQERIDPRQTKVFTKWLKHPWFQYFVQILEHQDVNEFFDDNFGLAIRNGKPTIVVLDTGLS